MKKKPPVLETIHCMKPDCDSTEDSLTAFDPIQTVNFMMLKGWIYCGSNRFMCPKCLEGK